MLIKSAAFSHFYDGTFDAIYVCYASGNFSFHFPQHVIFIDRTQHKGKLKHLKFHIYMINLIHTYHHSILNFTVR